MNKSALLRLQWCILTNFLSRSFWGVGVVLILLLPLAGCLNFGGRGNISAQENSPEQERIRESELRAYCPQVILPDQSAFYSIYERGGEGDASRLVYLAAIDKVTRSCRYADGQMIMEIAAAGRVVPGPRFNASLLTLFFNVRVERGGERLYDKRGEHQLNVTAQGGAVQFIFKDSAVAVPQPKARDLRAVIGLDAPRRAPGRS